MGLCMDSYLEEWNEHWSLSSRAWGLWGMVGLRQSLVELLPLERSCCYIFINEN